MWRLYFICLQQIWKSAWYVLCIKISEHKNSVHSVMYENVKNCCFCVSLSAPSVCSVCVCVFECACVCARVHVRVSVVSLLCVCMQVYVWFNMTCDCFSSPLLSFPLYLHHRQIFIIMLLHLGNWEWWTVCVKVKPCEIRGSLSHSIVSKSLLICYTRSDGKQLLMFPSSVVPSSSRNALTPKLQPLQFFTTTVNI